MVEPPRTHMKLPCSPASPNQPGIGHSVDQSAIAFQRNLPGSPFRRQHSPAPVSVREENAHLLSGFSVLLPH